VRILNPDSFEGEKYSALQTLGGPRRFRAVIAPEPTTGLLLMGGVPGLAVFPSQVAERV